MNKFIKWLMYALRILWAIWPVLLIASIVVYDYHFGS